VESQKVKNERFFSFCKLPVSSKIPKDFFEPAFSNHVLKIDFSLIENSFNPLYRACPPVYKDQKSYIICIQAFKLWYSANAYHKFYFWKKNIRKALPLILTPALRAAGSSLMEDIHEMMLWNLTCMFRVDMTTVLIQITSFFKSGKCLKVDAFW